MRNKVLWNISITSHSECMGLVKEEINYLMNIFNDSEYREEYNDIKARVKNTFPDDEVAVWQCDKGVEIDKLFEDNLKYDISDDEVTIVCDYNVYLGDSFDNDDVICWATGLHHLTQILPRIDMNNIKNSYVNKLELTDNLSNKYKPFLQEITNNQIINVTRISR